MTGTSNPSNPSLVDKVKAKVDNVLHKDKSSSTTTSTSHTTTSGQHSGLVGEGQAGPHSSRAANAADLRFNSDLDGSHKAGLSHDTGHSAGTGIASTGLTGTGTGHHNTAAYGPTHSTHSGTTGLAGHTGTQHTGGLSNSTNAGPHNSKLANTLDPRVDSDLSGPGNSHGHSTGGILGASGSHATRGSGTAQNTDGPHNSDRLNQLDPRVDSNRDRSTTLGGNKTNY